MLDCSIFVNYLHILKFDFKFQHLFLALSMYVLFVLCWSVQCLFVYRSLFISVYVVCLFNVHVFLWLVIWLSRLVSVCSCLFYVGCVLLAKLLRMVQGVDTSWLETNKQTSKQTNKQTNKWALKGGSTSGNYSKKKWL